MATSPSVRRVVTIDVPPSLKLLTPVRRALLPNQSGRTLEALKAYADARLRRLTGGGGPRRRWAHAGHRAPSAYANAPHDACWEVRGAIAAVAAANPPGAAENRLVGVPTPRGPAAGTTTHG